jgi:cardiolipin synthase
LRSSDVPLFPDEEPAEDAGTQIAKFTIRDNLRHRRDIERAYLAGLRTAREEILIATAYFFPGVRFRRALMNAAARGVRVTLLLQARVEYRLLHYAARALYGQLLAAGIGIQEYHRSFLHAKVAVVDSQWATVGSSNIDPYSFLMSREANVFVRDRAFASELRVELAQMIESGSRPVPPQDWANRSRFAKAVSWTAYGIVRVAMGMLRYGGDEWWRSGWPQR